MTTEHPPSHSLNRMISTSRVLLLLFAVVTLGSYGLSAYYNHKQNQKTQTVITQQGEDVQCLSDTLDRVIDRQEALTAVNNARVAAGEVEKQAFGALVEGIRSNLPQAELSRLFNIFARKLEAENRANAAYDKAAKLHPVPSPPKVVCSDRLKLRPTGPPTTTPNDPPTPPVVTSTAHSTRTRTTTATAVATVTATVTQTQVVVRPGPDRTVTVTRTKSPPALPSCLTHPLPPCILQLP